MAIAFGKLSIERVNTTITFWLSRFVYGQIRTLSRPRRAKTNLNAIALRGEVRQESASYAAAITGAAVVKEGSGAGAAGILL